MNQQFKLKTSVAAVALTLSASHIALAQDSATQPITRVTVTGSNIKRVEADGTSAIQTITKADIRASGANTVQELLQKVPSLGAGASFDSTDGGFSRGAATASLRGLGPASTLILLNGRRLTPSAYADPNNGKSTAYDLNNIPLSAIERVEVFKDGASAVYGSDAIAGVINFITRQDYQGAEVSAGYSANDNNKFQNKHANAVFGFGNLATDRYNGFVAVDVSQRQSVLIKDVNDIEKAEYADINYRLNPFSSNLSSSPFFYRERGPGLNSYANSLALGSQVINKLNCDPSRQIVGDPATMNIATTSALNGRKFCNFNLNDYNEAQSAGKDASVLSRVNFQLTQSVQAFGEFAATRSERTYLAAPRSTQGTASTAVFLLNGAPQQFQLVLPVGAPDNPFPGARSAVGIRFEGRESGQKNVNETYRGLVGLKGTNAGWDWESGLLWNRNERTENYLGMLYRPTLLKVNQGVETLDQLLSDPTATRNLTNHGYSQVTQLDAKASTEFGQLGGGAMGVAIGAEARQEKIGLTPDAETQAGNIIGLSNASASGSRVVKSGFVELRTPFTKAFEMSFAGRVDKYPTFNTNFAPKVDAKWTIAPTVAFRANVARGFRAPGLTQVSDGGVQFFQTVVDPIRCTNGTTPNAGADQADCAKGISGTAAANKNLAPEKSKSYSFGVILSPVKNFDLSVDYYDIRKTAETALQSSDYVLNHQDLYPGRVIRDQNQNNWIKDANGNLIPNSGPIQQILIPFVNQGATEVRGIDLDATLRTNLGERGSLTTKANVSYTLAYLRSEAVGDVEHNAAGTNGGLSDWATSVGDIPRFKSTLLNSWKKGPHEASLLIRYVGPISLLRRYDNAVTYPVPYCYYGSGQPSTAYSLGGLPKYSNYHPDCSVKSFTTMDVGYVYTGIENVTLSLNIQNILDTKQPYDPRFGTTGYNPALSFGQGRYFSLNASYRFK